MIRAVEGRSCQGEQAVGEGSWQREPEGSLGVSHVRRKSSGGRGQQVQRPWGGWLWGCTRGAERGPSQLEWRESAEERREVRSEMPAGARSQRTPQKFGGHSENSGDPSEGWFAG